MNDKNVWCEAGKITYYLVHRISGWSDKTEILELYNVKPHFNHCSISQVDPLYGDSLALSKTIAHVYLNTQENKLDIEYVDGVLIKSPKWDVKLETRFPRLIRTNGIYGLHF